MIKANIILPHEAERIEKVDEKTPHESSWTPILWAIKLLTKANAEGKIKMEVTEIHNIRDRS